ncbi:MAG: hypothetical protein CO118_11235 [Flavobacteriales bacterium CG_4_9_14_3_um_filter_32_8]|nr:MAG: hypothetical protein CO118_11235 [Flavobacteriales bacterium CG_4_9_14_3_um_filter_32_8]
MNTSKNRTAIILSGGKSSRMGIDKGLLLLNGKPMIQYVIDVVTPLVDEVIIISNQIEYQRFGLPVYEDLIKDAGPLAGIYTGLKYSKHDKNIVVSCDVPFISEKLFQYLINFCTNYDVTIPIKNNKTHQVIGIYDKKCIPIFKNELDNNQRKMKVALEKINLNIVDANQFDEKEFTNINTSTELKNIA